MAGLSVQANRSFWSEALCVWSRIKHLLHEDSVVSPSVIRCAHEVKPCALTQVSVAGTDTVRTPLPSQ